jgi:catechol 2,3-dioxygenase-like lactoylglutathione lyase family enzyme
MLDGSRAFAGFAVDDLDRARAFYGTTLGVDVRDGPMGSLELHVGGGNPVFIYSKPDHEPAAHTILNFPVDDIDATVDRLTSAGVTFERYDGIEADARGIARGRAAGQGPDIAWFKDPAGNVLSVMEG